MVKPKGEYRHVVTHRLQAMFAADRFVKAAYDGSIVMRGTPATP